MSYYLLNRQEILEKRKKRYSKEKAVEYYLQNKEVINEKAKNHYKNLSEEKRTKSKSIKRKGIKNWFNMSEKTLKFNNIKINKKEIHKTKQAIELDSIITDKIVVSDKFWHSKEGLKYVIGYQENEIVKPLCIILPQVHGCIKYFENGGKHVFIN